MGISDISWSVSVIAPSELEALELAVEQARPLNRGSGMPPHGIHLSEAELREVAFVLPLPTT